MAIRFLTKIKSKEKDEGSPLQENVLGWLIVPMPGINNQ